MTMRGGSSVPQKELVNGVIYWLAIAILVALASRIAKLSRNTIPERPFNNSECKYLMMV